MKRHSLYTLVFGISAVSIVVSFISIYFSVNLHRKDLLETALEEKTRLAVTINEIIAAPNFAYEMAKFPILEKTIISETAKFKDVRYIRIVKLDGSIYQSNIEEDWAKTIDDPDIKKAITTKKTIIRDEVFRGEKLKTIIYPGYYDKTIWVGFSLKSTEEATRALLIRDLLMALGGLILIILVVFTILRTIVIPLKRITTACQEVRRGNLDVKIDTRSKNEIGELASTFNQTVKDLKGSYRSLEEERNKTQSIIANLADGLLVLDEKNKVVLINSQGKQLLNVKEEISGKRLNELIENPFFKKLLILLSAGEAPQALFREELFLEKPAKQVLEVTTVSLAPWGEQVIILHDITREKLVEKAKTEFVSLAAHQLRMPLTAIKWALKMLLDGDFGKITKEQGEMVEKTYKSNERMIGLVGDLLDITRIEEGRYVYKPTPTDLESVIRFVINSYREAIKMKKLEFKFERLETKLPQVTIDIEKIRMVIQNLLDNSIRYTPAGGRVTIFLKHDKKEINFSIKDTGVGIPRDQQDRVFSKFFRGTNVVKLETEGSGLGLFLAKNIVEAHGGKIWFESEENKGTTFYFNLPIK